MRKRLQRGRMLIRRWGVIWDDYEMAVPQVQEVVRSVRAGYAGTEDEPHLQGLPVLPGWQGG